MGFVDVFVLAERHQEHFWPRSIFQLVVGATKLTQHHDANDFLLDKKTHLGFSWRGWAVSCSGIEEVGFVDCF